MSPLRERNESTSRPLHAAQAASIAAVGLAVVLLASPADARAQHTIRTPYEGTRPIEGEAYAGYSWYGAGFVAGLRVDVPLLQNGLVATLDNTIVFGVGIEVLVIDDANVTAPSYGVGLAVPLSLRWEFFFDATWSLFVEVGARAVFHPALFSRGEFYADPAAWVIGQLGVSAHVSETVALTLRVGNPFAALGVAVAF